MEILIIIALIVAGLLLFAVEVFLVPGITLAGIASGVSLLYAIYLRVSCCRHAGRIHHTCRCCSRNNRCYHLVHAFQDRRPPVAQENTRLQA